MSHGDHGDERSAAPAGEPGWETLALSGLNALVGDYLDASGNALAVTMGLYHRGAPLPCATDALRAAHPGATRKVCVLVHGLGCHEGVWTFPAPPAAPPCTYGTLLRDDLGFTPLAVRYNTGLQVARSGALLADLLGGLAAAYPAPLDEIVLIGHSMGGLVIEAAYHLGVARQEPWAARVSRVFYLGTPHHGADLARLGHVADVVLAAIPNPITRLVGEILGLRSQGVKDLRYGALRHHPSADAPPALDGALARHYIIAGSLGLETQHLIAQLIGDGLVRPPRPDAIAALPPDQIRLLPQMHHMQLAHDHRVYHQLKAWCEG